ncbi:hypothetical protein EDB83DRAFT_2324076 [Lactarius deliciosus]|nr:hypothetical protein EDB83DRAFT_2324076 [Lactarius deliciosus]
MHSLVPASHHYAFMYPPGRGPTQVQTTGKTTTMIWSASDRESTGSAWSSGQRSRRDGSSHGRNSFYIDHTKREEKTIHNQPLRDPRGPKKRRRTVGQSPDSPGDHKRSVPSPSSSTFRLYSGSLRAARPRFLLLRMVWASGNRRAEDRLNSYPSTLHGVAQSEMTTFDDSRTACCDLFSFCQCQCRYQQYTEDFVTVKFGSYKIDA